MKLKNQLKSRNIFFVFLLALCVSFTIKGYSQSQQTPIYFENGEIGTYSEGRGAVYIHYPKDPYPTAFVPSQVYLDPIEPDEPSYIVLEARNLRIVYHHSGSGMKGKVWFHGEYLSFTD